MKSKTSKELISIIIPVRNEEGNLRVLLPRVMKAVRKIGKYRFEIIVVCNNCTDNSVSVVRNNKLICLEKEYKDKKYANKSLALVDGFKIAKGKIFIMMDADLAHLPEDIDKMISKLNSKKNIGLVIASRELGGSDDATPIRRFGGITLNHLTNLFFGTNLTDAINGYKIFYRDLFDNFTYTAGGYAIEIELVANAVRLGYEVAEIAGFEPKRTEGRAKSKVIRDGWLFLKEVLKQGVKYNLEKLS